MLKGSDPERFEAAYRQIWFAFNRSDDPDLSQHERQVLHHVPETGGVALGWLAHHLALPKSTTSVLVKGLERRGFVHRRRDRDDERRLAVVLTAKGRRRVAGDTVLVPDRLAVALSALPATTRRGLLDGMERLALESRRPGSGEG